MKIKGLRWWIIALIALGTVINYIDRSALGVMWWAEGDCIAKDLGYTTICYNSECIYGLLRHWTIPDGKNI